MKPIYFISGLGADKRVFSLLDISFCHPVFVDWIRPHPKESLTQYAARLRESMIESHPVVVGISFGGMLATEMAKADPNLKAIIISSNKIATELPPWWRFAKYMPAWQWLPATFLRKFMLANRWILGGAGKQQKKLLQEVLTDSDIYFTKWAIDAILHWNNRTIPPNVVHIHGNRDKLLPSRFVKADYIVQGGTHVMTLDQPAEVSTLLKKLIF